MNLRTMAFCLGLGLLAWFATDEKLRQGEYSADQIILGIMVFAMMYGVAYLGTRRRK